MPNPLYLFGRSCTHNQEMSGIQGIRLWVFSVAHPSLYPFPFVDSTPLGCDHQPARNCWGTSESWLWSWAPRLSRKYPPTPCLWAWLSGGHRSPDTNLHDTAPPVYPAGHQLQWYVWRPHPRALTMEKGCVGQFKESGKNLNSQYVKGWGNTHTTCLLDALIKFIQNPDSVFLKFRRHDHLSYKRVGVRFCLMCEGWQMTILFAFCSSRTHMSALSLYSWLLGHRGVFGVLGCWCQCSGECFIPIDGVSQAPPH